MEFQPQTGHNDKSTLLTFIAILGEVSWHPTYMREKKIAASVEKHTSNRREKVRDAIAILQWTTIRTGNM